MKTYKIPDAALIRMNPREMALEYGVTRLNDLDLMQIILGSGTRGQPVRQLAAQVLKLMDTLGGTPDPERLQIIHGIGQAKASVLCAAVELCRRFYLPERCRVRHPEDAWQLVRHYADRPQELFLVIHLNGASEATHTQLVSMGILNRTLVHPREIFAEAVQRRAASIMVAHNHPSGILEPSSDDMEITRRLMESGRLLGIPVLDHVIFSPSSFFSFLDHGLI